MCSNGGTIEKPTSRLPKGVHILAAIITTISGRPEVGREGILGESTETGERKGGRVPSGRGGGGKAKKVSPPQQTSFNSVKAFVRVRNPFRGVAIK